jgi:hypothetical protein
MDREMRFIHSCMSAARGLVLPTSLALKPFESLNLRVY